MNIRVAGLRALTVAIAMIVSLGATACTTNNFNCNVKDACRVPDAARAVNP